MKNEKFTILSKKKSKRLFKNKKLIFLISILIILFFVVFFTLTNKFNLNNQNKNYTETVNRVSFEMVYVEGGNFSMGCTSEQGSDCYDREKPAFHVSLTSYYIGKYEVTQSLWQAVMGTNPSENKEDDLPVENVSWNDIQVFILKLNRLTGQIYRLPTEAEWEFAARGGNKSKGYKYAGSNFPNDVAWYYDNSNFKTHIVGSKLPNELGIFDMSGNVYEWCQDLYEYYNSELQPKYKDPSIGISRVLRGGGKSCFARNCRVSYRDYIDPNGHYNDRGFRLCLNK